MPFKYTAFNEFIRSLTFLFFPKSKMQTRDHNHMKQAQIAFGSASANEVNTRVSVR